MNKTMTLGKRISIGFGILLFITLALGILAIVNMRNASQDSAKLAEVYAPEVEIASKIFASANQIRYDVRAFTMQDNEQSLANAKKEFINLQKYLNEAQVHGKKYHLTNLIEGEQKASKSTLEYIASNDRSEKLLERKKQYDAAMVENATLFMKNASKYLDNQESKLKEEINTKQDGAKLVSRLTKISHINEVIDLAHNTRVLGQRAQLKRDLKMLENAVASFDVIYKLLTEIKANTVQANNLEDLKNIENAAKVYEASLKGMISVMQETATENAIRVKAAADVLDAASSVMQLGVGNTKEVSDNASDSLSVASVVMLIGLVIAVIISLLTAVFIIRSIVKVVVESVKSLSEGTTQVVSASEQISSASVSLAEGASSQASSVEEVSATIEQATASNNQNAENSREANILAQHSNDAAKEGNQRVQDLMVAMEKITDSSQKIAKIIKTIDEIAFQTNLLALNAAVEAARAGEHGLGFAVVAEEVKNLAERSAGAAKEITGIIEASIDQVKAGTEVANKTKESFTEILNGIKKTSDLIGEIAISAKEQAEGMNQIATAMGSVDQITQQNASASEETAAAAEELNAQALAMLQSVAEMAALAGFDMGKDSPRPSLASTTKRLSPVVPAPKRLSVTSGAKKVKTPSFSQTASKRSNEDVFPLGEDDLKEF